MKFAVNINGQFKGMTGIHQYVDSLMGGLFSLQTPHEITAFASTVWSRPMLEGVTTDQRFAWRTLPAARIETVGNDFTLSGWSWFARSPRLAEHLDTLVVNKLKGRTYSGRTTRATRQYDVMHIPEAHIMDFFGYEPKQFVGTIYDVTTITMAPMHNAENIATWAKYYDFVKTRCARVLTISEFSKHDIVEHLGIAPDRIDVTPLAARASAARMEDLAARQPTLDKFGIATRPFVLYAGTLEPRKNLMRLVSAFAQVVGEARLTDHRLVLAGGHWAAHDQELRRHAKALGIEAQLILTGYVSNAEMNALMSSCAAFAYVSEYEGFGLPPLEAMVCGAPVVASNTTSLPEVVGDAGIQVDPTDVEAIAAALHGLLTDIEANQQRRTLSLAQARRFSWKRTAELTLQSYEAAVA